MLSHYLELLANRRRLLYWTMTAVPLAVFLLSIIMRLVAPVYTSYAIVTMAPTKVELDYTNAWSKQNLGSPTEISTQTVVEFLYSTPVLEIALNKIIATLGGAPTSPSPPNMFVALLDKTVKLLASSFWRIYYTLDRGAFFEPTPHELMLFQLRKGSLVEPMMGTYLLRIEVSYEDPKIAAIATNALADAYIERATQIAYERAARLRTALEGEVATLTADLNRLDQERPAIIQSRGPAGVEAFDRQVQRAEEDLQAARARLVAFNLEAGDTKQSVQVIEPATPPAYPTIPRLLIYFLAAVIGSGLIGVMTIVGLDLFGGTVTTSHDLRCLVGDAFLGSVVAVPSILDPWRRRRNRGQLALDASRSESLRTALAIKGLLDLNQLQIVGINSTTGAQIVAHQIRDALDYILLVQSPHLGASASGASNGQDERSEEKTSLPKVTLMKPMAAGFRWSDVAGADTALVVAVPAGKARDKELLDILGHGQSLPDIRVLFCLTDG